MEQRSTSVPGTRLTHAHVNVMTSTRLLGPGLLTTEGAQHRKQRKMLTPVFSIAYLRGITSVFYETNHKVDKRLAQLSVCVT